ncbi:hypothetical protein PybrP1_011912 [[Pythium] brassicae (nom. inval.)]|nr:hypothetical protein PybrP1_011912 [[Pythium] brassicae (nom. inval.)]
MSDIASDAAASAFESAVMSRSQRRDSVGAAVGYYLVRVRGNARVFVRESLERNARVDAAVLLEGGREEESTHSGQQLAWLSKREKERLAQVAKHARAQTFRERLLSMRNGVVLLARLEQTLTRDVSSRSTGKDSSQSSSSGCGGVRARNAVSSAERGPAFSTSHPAVRTTSFRNVAAGSNSSSNAADASNSSPDSIVQLESTCVASLRSETSVARAYALQQQQPRRFEAYRAFFKHDSLALATAISRRCKDKSTKREVREWIKRAIGPIPAFVATPEQRAKRQRAFRNCELRHLALVAAALTVYGEHVLSALYDSDNDSDSRCAWRDDGGRVGGGESAMRSLQDIPLVSDELRDVRKQRECLQRARWPGKYRLAAVANPHMTATATASTEAASSRLVAGAMHAAHYLPLDLAIQWNNALPPAQRLSAAALCRILNHPSNLKAVPHSVNTSAHRRVEHFIAAFIKQVGASGSVDFGNGSTAHKRATWLAWRNTRDRLAQIAARAQSPELRGAFVRAGGEALYALVEQTFRRIEAEFVARGFDFGGIWDCDEAEGTGALSQQRRKRDEQRQRALLACIEIQRFESEMLERSMRGDHPEYALGYFVSLELLHGLNSRAKKREQVKAAHLPRLVLAACNAKMTFHAAAARHKQVDALLLAGSDDERPATLTKAKRKRLQQLAERVADPSFQVQRALFADDEDVVEPEQLTATDSAPSDTSVIRAYAVSCASPARFRAYRVYFKNDNVPLATEISRRCSDKVGKKEIREWIRSTIGPIPVFDAARDERSRRQTTFRNAELRHLALVATALSLYSEPRLSALYDADPDAMASCEDIPLVSDELRDTSAQQQCVKAARSGGASAWLPPGDLHAAHYVPIDLAIQWNNSLPVARRVSTASLRSVLNLQANLRAVPAQVNVRDHRKVEHFVAAFIRDGARATPKCRSWLWRRNCWDRLAVVAARVQAPAFRDALVHETNGDAFAARVQLTFEQIEREFAAWGFASLSGLWGRARADDDSAVADHTRRLMNVFLELLG